MKLRTGTALAVLAAALTVFVTTCRKPPDEEKEEKGFEHQYVPEFQPPPDLSALAGARIVIDPGHGGRFTGAIASTGLREADVNLEVALALWGFLKEAGARPVLTRSTDSPVAKHRRATLKEDLIARTKIAEKAQRGIFVSIHHNADIHPDSVKNALEVYYKLADPGASLDIARRIVRRAAQVPLPGNRPKYVRPGNYRVLRENVLPSALVELSYMTYKPNAKLLRQPSVVNAEARAILGGLADYFAAGFPSAEPLEPEPDSTVESVRAVRARVDPGERAEIDPLSTRIFLDGERVNVHYVSETREVAFTPDGPLRNGLHEALVTFRNSNGNAAVPARWTFTVAAKPAHMTLRAIPDRLPTAGEPIGAVVAEILDGNIQHVADGTEVQFECSGCEVVAAATVTEGGTATAYIKPDGEGRECRVRLTCGDVSSETAIVVDEQSSSLLVCELTDAVSGAPVPGATIVIGATAWATSDGLGHALFPSLAPAGYELSVVKDGYVPMRRETDVGESQAVGVREALLPVARGVLHGVRIMIDPECGGEIPGRIGPSGVRAADINVRVAELLYAYLERAGAIVALARERDETVTPLQRVLRSEEFKPDLYVGINHGLDDPEQAGLLNEDEMALEEDISSVTYVSHYPKSPEGIKLSRQIIDYLAGAVGTIEARAVPSVAYTLVHTGCPAVSVHPFEPESVLAEDKLDSTGFQRKEAYAIFCGLLSFSGLDEDETGRIKDIVKADGNPVAGAAVVLDETFMLQTDEDGGFEFRLVDPGPHTITVSGAGRTVSCSVRVAQGRTTAATVDLSADAAGDGRGL